MLIYIVSQYLAAHKRLVIPQLGTFIVKEPGRSVLFSELLRRDDGVLRQLLRDEGMAELEAAGEIDRFVFEIRHAVEHGRDYPLPGFGVMKPGPNATIAFVYEPRTETLQGEDRETPPSGPAETPQGGAGETPQGGAATAGRSPQLQPGKLSEAVKTAFAEPRVSSSVKMNPDPSVRGLRYGKPPKSTDAYTFVDRAPRRRIDRVVIWLAILAAAIAVAAIAFGYFRDMQERRAEAEYLQLTQPQPSATPAADDAAAGQTTDEQ